MINDSEILKAKPLWKDRSAQVWSFYCPLCRANRRVPFHPRPGSFRQIAQLAATTAFVTLATWHWFDWKGIVAIVPLWGAFELFYRTRVRANLSCPDCGFDPYLYLTDVQRARREIENHWRKKFAEKNVPFPERPAAPKTAFRRSEAQTSGKNSSPAPRAPQQNN